MRKISIESSVIVSFESFVCVPAEGSLPTVNLA